MTTTGQTLEQGTAVWEIDSAHTHVDFAVRHLMISTVKGRFGDVKGTLTVDGDDLATASLEVEIDAASIDTHVEQRDEHLRSEDFLDVGRYPTLRFRSTRVERDGDDRLQVRGDLTIRDVTREVTLEVEERGTAHDPWGGERTGFSASASVDRTDFGLTWNQALEAGGVLVGDKVRISIDAQLVLKEG